eukprot:390155-Pelagomonas_calceolata.AAC.3
MAFTDQLNVSQNTQQRFFMEYPSLHLQTQNYGKLAAPTNGDMRDDDAWDKYRFNIALQHSMHHPACFSKTQANIPLNWCQNPAQHFSKYNVMSSCSASSCLLSCCQLVSLLSYFKAADLV